MNKFWKSDILYYFIGSVISIGYCFFAFDLWDYDFNVPLSYWDGDVMFTLMTLQKMLDGFFVNVFQGAPFEAVFVDFPLYGDMLNLFALRIILLLNGANLGNAINVYYFALFPLTFCIAFFVMRKLEIQKVFAFSGALLYAFLPYRFLRSTGHLFLSNYSFVPLNPPSFI